MLSDPGRSLQALKPPRGRSRRFRLAAICRAREGSTTVEIALLLPVFLTFLLGIEEVGRAVWTQATLQYAVEEAARCAAVTPSNCTDVATYAANQTGISSVASTDFTYTANASCGITGYGAGAQVTASHAFDPLVPNLVSMSVTLTAKSCHP